LGILFWVIFCASFPFILFYLIKRELPRLLPLNFRFWLSSLLFVIAASLFIFTYLFARSLISSAALVCLIIAFTGFLPRLPRRLIPWRDILFTFLLAIALFSPILADGIPRGPDTWAKPYLARSAAASIATLTEPGWDIGWMLGFDYTVYGAFSPVMSGIFAFLGGDHFLGVRLEMFTAFLFLPPLAYLVGKRVGRNRWGGFITLVILVSARLALGYIGIARFWAVALLPALWLTLCGWRDGKCGYAPLVAFFLAAAIFIHAQVGAMALLLFSGFSLEMLWRHRKGVFKAWVGIVLVTVGVTAIWWQNILESSPVVFVAPQLNPWDPGTFDRAWYLTSSILLQLINPVYAMHQLPNIYSHAWFLGAISVLSGLIGIVILCMKKQKWSGVFPAIWTGGIALLINIPLFYLIPALGIFTQHLVFPDFGEDANEGIFIGLQQRFFLLCLMMLGVLAAKMPSLINHLKKPFFRKIAMPGILVLLTCVIWENQPFWSSYLNANNEIDPRKADLVQNVQHYFNEFSPKDKILYDLEIDYGGILQSSINTIPVLQAWIASGFNSNFAYKYLWSLQESGTKDPERLVRMLSAIGTQHYIMLNTIQSRILLARMGRMPSSVHGAWLVAQIPINYDYLRPAKLVEVYDKKQIDYDNWDKTPWKVYTITGYHYESEADDAPPNAILSEGNLRKIPNKVEIAYELNASGVVACNLAYQPELRSTLDGKPLRISENLVNGLIWFESPAGSHTIVIYRERSITGWLALGCSTLALILIFFLIISRKRSLTQVKRS